MAKKSNRSAKVTKVRANGHGSDVVQNTQAGLDRIDVAALAQLYNSPPASHIARQDLLEQARTALMKYELAEDDLAIASDSLARSMHMLLEQHGVKKLEPAHMAALEKDVLDWCGFSYPTSPIKAPFKSNALRQKDEIKSKVDPRSGTAQIIPLATVAITTTAAHKNQIRH